MGKPSRPKAKFIEQIDQLQNEMRFVDALACIDQALAEFPNDTRIKLKRGVVLRRLRRLEESTAQLSALLESNPDNIAVRHHLSISLKLSGRIEESLRLSEKNLKVNPAYRPSHRALIATRTYAERYTAALASIDQALKYFPDDVEFKLSRGVTLRKLARFEDSIDDLSSLAALAPDHLNVLHELAVSLRMVERFEESLAISEQVMRENPSHHPSLLVGPRNAEKIIFVVNRTSTNKRSASISGMLQALHEAGYSLCFVPYNTAKSNFENANALRRFLKLFSGSEVFVIAQSAGGIVATLCEDAPEVAKIVCFGYPFKHPEREEEPERTDHLGALKKPFLLVQGTADPYGNEDRAKRYSLSETIEFLSVRADHDYHSLDDADYRKCLDRISEFFH